MQAAYDKIVRIHISSAITLRFNTWQEPCFTTLLTNQRTNHMKKLKYIAPVLIALACFGLQQAKATTTYTLSNPNGAIAAFPAPYGSVTVNLDVTQTIATITFTAANTAAFQYLFGDGGTAAVNVNGAFTLGAITGTHLPGFGFHAGEGYSNGGAGQVDGF